MDPETAPAAPGLDEPRFWQLKPWWCQPWSILLTGSGAIAISWLLLGRWWITAPLAGAVLLWWWLFLLAVPSAHAEAARAAEDQNRKR